MTSHDYDLIPSNAILSALSGAVAFVMQSEILIGLVMPIAFFIVGKGVDVAVRVWIEKRK